MQRTGIRGPGPVPPVKTPVVLGAVGAEGGPPWCLGQLLKAGDLQGCRGQTRAALEEGCFGSWQRGRGESWGGTVWGSGQAVDRPGRVLSPGKQGVSGGSTWCKGTL